MAVSAVRPTRARHEAAARALESSVRAREFTTDHT